MQGTITDHRDGVATEYGPGVGWPEDRHTVHWLENRGTTPAVEISVDIVKAAVGRGHERIGISCTTDELPIPAHTSPCASSN
ncbi:MAG: hypothetical protein R3A10_11520 [Caldilineaceae bacterium]